MQGSLSIERMCQMGQVSRAGFYRSLKEQRPVEEDMEVRSAIQQIALEHRRRYGSRRIAQTLRRRGMVVNRKRVARIMREDHLLAIQPKAFVVTTDSDHELEVYLNIASRMKLTGINQLWVADITLHSTPGRVRLSRGDPGRIFAKGGGLVTRSNARHPLASSGTGASHRRTAAAARLGSPLRSGRAIRLRRLRQDVEQAPTDPQHEPAGEPLRQRQLREFHQDAQT